ncbi:MAG: hypothetical protein CMO30_20640 [Tistrella sp.]|uniref:Uncharacterized protein n=1 Tax=Tistrella mobilis TaxID=171437 RepID=A0A3B9ISP8_9PROT|nr:hypothetical protein [Tistrella sp.]MAD39932.1 hypothetical protein [Tistrella sp.]MBA77684.1 hypothetical protein [Tistrella sp.]HAE50874.1 hypothetical protein [Tistrella mobilis]|tara:strand:+ start:254 stop:610 length:357 start_codon:yes stop_codon:yes gene_type:complete
MIVFLRWLCLIFGTVILSSALFLWIVLTYVLGMLPDVSGILGGLGLRMPSLVSLVLTGLAFLGAGLLLCRVPGRPRHRPPSTLSPPSAARPFTPLPPLKAGRGREARLSRRGGRIDRL